MKAGKFLLMAAILAGAAFTANAQSWVPTGAPSNAWHCLAASADATRLAAGVYQTLGTPTGGPIYLSSDSGTNWTPANVANNKWSAIASSADGSKLFAVADDGIRTACRVISSTNSGATWSTNLLGKGVQAIDYLPQIACSADGSKLVASYYGVIWTSTNSGGLWTSNSPPIQNWESPEWFSAACSADGNKLIALKTPQQFAFGYPFVPNVFISTNTGATWLQISNLPYLGYVSSSADGNTLIIAMGSGVSPKAFVTTNAGANWTTNALSLYAAGISLSADGTRMFSAGQGGWIRSSTNAGAAWMTNDTFAINMQWAGGAMSADGTKWFLTSQPSGNTNSGRIFTWQTNSAPTLNLTPAGGNLSLSWLLPAASFGLQQSLDLVSWSDLTNGPVLNLTNLQNQVTLPGPAGNGAFYRLKTP